MQSFHRNHVNWFLAARRLAPLEEHGRLLYAPATSCFLIIFYIYQNTKFPFIQHNNNNKNQNENTKSSLTPTSHTLTPAFNTPSISCFLNLFIFIKIPNYPSSNLIIMIKTSIKIQKSSRTQVYKFILSMVFWLFHYTLKIQKHLFIFNQSDNG